MQNRTCRSAREVGLHRFGVLYSFFSCKETFVNPKICQQLNTYRWWQVHILTSHTLVDLHDVIASGIKVTLRIVRFGNEYLVVSTIVNRDQHRAHIRESVGGENEGRNGVMESWEGLLLFQHRSNDLKRGLQFLLRVICLDCSTNDSNVLALRANIMRRGDARNVNIYK